MTEQTESASDKKWYEAACHCHAVEYKILLADVYTPGAQTTIECNCSICLKNGYILIYPKREDLVWLKGEDTLKNYVFATKTRDHRFCPNCGSSTSEVRIPPVVTYLESMQWKWGASA